MSHAVETRLPALLTADDLEWFWLVFALMYTQMTWCTVMCITAIAVTRLLSAPIVPATYNWRIKEGTSAHVACLACILKYYSSTPNAQPGVRTLSCLV